MYGIESANIVGYTTTELERGGNNAGAAFLQIGAGTTIDLSKITVTGYDKNDGCEADVNVQLLDEFGRTVTTYEWYNIEDGGDVYYGWYEEDADDPIAEGEVTVQAGSGLWAYAKTGEFALQSSGQVPSDSSIAVLLGKGGNSIVNPTPVVVDLSKCYVEGYDKDDGCEADVNVQLLDEFGRTITTYEWYDIEDGGDVYYGWYEEDADDPIALDEVTIDPGKGLWAYAKGASYSFVWPKVEIK